MNRKPPVTFLLFFFIFILFNSCSKSTDSSTSATVTKLGINTSGGWSDSPFISRDGQRLYFMYSRYNFGPWIISGGSTPPQLTGPDRPGLHLY